MNIKQFTAGPNEEGVRLSRFVLRVTTGLPHSLLYKALRTKRIKVNGKKAAADTRLHTDDVVELYLDDAFFIKDAAAQSKAANPAGASVGSVQTAAAVQDVSFGIVYEDDMLAVLYKPPGLQSHSGKPGAPDLLAAFTARLIGRGEFRPQDENTFAPALCNRLDRNTEGLLLAAKTYPALRDANALLRGGQIQKIYLCVTKGAPPKGIHTAYLTRDRTSKTVVVAADAAPGAKEITTGVTVLHVQSGLALCEVSLLTGRTHQIRAHLAYLGAPVLGDTKYGDAKFNKACAIFKQALCAYRLVFSQDLPEENTLHSFAGRSFIAANTALQRTAVKLGFPAALFQ